MSNGGGNPRDGGPLRVAGQEFARGLGTAPASEARFHLGGHAARLTGGVGVDDESTGGARVAVLADDREIFAADVTAGQPVIPFDLDVSGVRTLVLRGSGDDSAHVDWVDPIVHVNQPPSTN